MVPFSFLLGTGSIGGHFVEVREDVLKRILESLLRDAVVDEGWYRSVNEDVDAAIHSGEMKSAHEHYICAGYFEDRLPRPIPVDEAWYLREYPDVAEAIRSGHFTSAEQHFGVAGFREGRLPHSNWTLFGSSNGNNSSARLGRASPNRRA
jgi:hypothetical protein